MKWRQNHGTLAVPSFWQHPLQYLRQGWQEWNAEEKHAEAISQGSFFDLQLSLMSGVRDYLLLEGYDAPFMEQGKTIDVLRTIIRGEARTPIYLSAILSEGKETVLHELAKGSERVQILHTPEPLVKGYTILDQHVLSIWDSTRPTPYIYERDKGIFHREMYFALTSPRAELEIRTYTRMFRESEQRLGKSEIK